MTSALRKDDGSNAARDQVYNLIAEKSFIRKPVVLSSGKQSNHYFDMKFTMLDPLGATLLAALIFDRLPKSQIDYVGGLELGAVPLISPIAALSLLRNRPIPGLIVRKAPKQHGSARLVEGAEDLKGKSIAIVDDVTTTGESAMKSIRALTQEGASIAVVISILDREEGAEQLYKEAGIPFDPLFRASEFLNAP